MVFPFENPQTLTHKKKKMINLQQVSLQWLLLYYKVDYLILLRKRECSLKALALLLVDICARREVFPLGGTAWGDGTNLSHIFIIRISRERLCCF
jgi:hypothetical protein